MSTLHSRLAFRGHVPKRAGVNVSTTARQIYRALRCNAAAVATIRQEFESLALAIATNPEAAFELTSSTVNGQTFSGSRTVTNADRLTLLSQIVWQLDNCTTLPSTTRIQF